MINEIVWAATLHGAYLISVTRTRAFRGRLTILHAGQIIHTHYVHLRYDGVFGIDIDDVDDWLEAAETVIHKHKMQPKR